MSTMTVFMIPVTAGYRVLVWLANSPKRLMLSYSILIVLGSILYRVFEDDVSYGDSLWWAVVTASTVGYGDISPESWQARVMAAVLISVMVLIVVPLITAHFASKLIVDTDAFHHEEQEELKRNLRETRALVAALAERAGVSAQDTLDRMPEPPDRPGIDRPRW